MKKIIFLFLILISFNVHSINWKWGPTSSNCNVGGQPHYCSVDNFGGDYYESSNSCSGNSGVVTWGCAKSGTLCTLPEKWDSITQSCSPPSPTCVEDNTQPICGPPSYSGGSVTNEDGSVTDTINECYSDGSCFHTETTSKNTKNPDGSSTYDETVKNSQTENGTETTSENISSTVTQSVETSDKGTKTTTTTSNTNSSGETVTITRTETVVRNDDGSTTVTITETSETGELISSESHIEDDLGQQVSDTVDCSDVAYISNPICRTDSFDDDTTVCGDYGLSVTGENRCVNQCPSSYIQSGNYCIKTNDNEVATDDTEQTENNLLTQISKTLTESKGIQTQIKTEISKTTNAVRDNTKAIVKAIKDQGQNLGGGGSPVEVTIPEQTGGKSWSKTGIFREFDHSAIDADIVQAKQDLKNIFTSIRSDMSAIFGQVSVTSSAGCSTSFEVMGQTYSFCVMDYKEQLSQIGLAMMAIAYLLAFVIIVRN